MTFDARRWNELLHRFYEDTLTIAESRELRALVREQITRVRKAGGPEEKLRDLILLRSATYEKEGLWAES
ncbi:MAG TPA: hypothetical protein VI997_02560 [Candidatus Thermoplasmatota archaeon]|nr:hypothetical protein [Candidatus Thermoplasmatota archaeon]